MSGGELKTVNIRLRVEPPLLIPWLSERERQANIMLLDLDADVEADATLRLDLNVVFNPLSVRRGVVKKVDYYVGSTGAEVSVQATGGAVSEHTQAATLDVNYSNTSKKQRKVGLSLTPVVKAKDGSAEVDATIGSITHEAAQETSVSATFASKERYLAPLRIGDTIKWTITLPRGEKVIRDFLTGNLYLFAKCAWASGPRSGTISIRPSDVRFFDHDRRPISTIRSLLMWFILWERYVKIENSDGFRIEFKEIQS